MASVSEVAVGEVAHINRRRAKMPRIAGLIVKQEEAVYHVISRTALDGYVIGGVEKDLLLTLIRKLSRVF